MSKTTTFDKTILAIDYGEKRIGLAVKKAGQDMIDILNYLPNSERALEDLQKIMDDLAVDYVVVGLPRGLDGQKTAQTEKAETFGMQLAQRCGAEVQYQDETLSSDEALNRLPKGITAKQQRERIDGLAAQVILEDHLA